MCQAELQHLHFGSLYSCYTGDACIFASFPVGFFPVGSQAKNKCQTGITHFYQALFCVKIEHKRTSSTSYQDCVCKVMVGTETWTLHLHILYV